MSNTPALRYNSGKSKLSYILSAPHAIRGVAEIMEFGSKKYSKNNWQKGMPYSEVLDSLLRHAAAFANGENIDPDSNLPHIDHVLCNALFLSEFTHTHPEMDDRSGEFPELGVRGILAPHLLIDWRLSL